MDINKIKKLSFIPHEEWLKIQENYCKSEKIKKINKKVYAEDLIETKKVLDSENIKFWLIFGTLLGAIREKDFLSWDDNINLAVLKEEIISKIDVLKEKFISLGFIIREIPKKEGLKINLYKNNHKISIEGLYSDPSYCDNKYLLSNKFRHPRKYFEKFGEIEFKGEKFRVPSPVEKYLEFLYKDWKTPTKDTLNSHKWRNKDCYKR